MTRYIGDQNQLGFFYESGTYATASGTLQWIGLVQEHTLTESVGVQNVRYVSQGDRNVGQFVDGPIDYEGTFTFFPQDWKFLPYALGSNVDGSPGGPFTHTVSESNSVDGNAFTSGINNPFLSFSLEDAKQGAAAGEHFIRTINGGMVDSLTISASQGEIVNVEVSYRAKETVFTSGTITAITAATTRPFRWDDVKLHIPSGTIMSALTEFSLAINNNLEGPHYMGGGSREVGVPIPLNRDYELTGVLHMRSEDAKTLWDQFFLGGSTFNALLEIDAAKTAGAGSRNVFFAFSGCKMTELETPTPGEGVTEQSFTILPQTSSIIVNDTIELYNIV